MKLQERVLGVNQCLAGGVTPAMASPIHPETEQVNAEVVPQLVDFLISRGVKGLFVGGTTGEGILLDNDQRKILHEASVLAASGRVPVLLHVGSSRMATAVDLARHAAEIGADGIVAVTPFFYGVHDDALLSYYQRIAEEAPGVPLFAYEIPHMAVNGVSPALSKRLFAEIPSLAGMKSSNPDAQAIRKLLDTVPDDRILLAGNESIALGSMALGADGMISGLATAVPEPMVAMTDAFFSGDLHEARRYQQLVNRLLAVIPAGARIGALKAILSARDVPVGPPLAPLPKEGSGIWAAQQELLAA